MAYLSCCTRLPHRSQRLVYWEIMHEYLHSEVNSQRLAVPARHIDNRSTSLCSTMNRQGRAFFHSYYIDSYNERVVTFVCESTNMNSQWKSQMVLLIMHFQLWFGVNSERFKILQYLIIYINEAVNHIVISDFINSVLIYKRNYECYNN